MSTMIYACTLSKNICFFECFIFFCIPFVENIINGMFTSSMVYDIFFYVKNVWSILESLRDSSNLHRLQSWIALEKKIF